jgi:TRAP-type uncharacterized transport system fused permease subunit
VAGLKLAAAAYVLPFLWVYNPAIIFDGTSGQIAVTVTLLTVAAVLLARGLAAGPAARTASLVQLAVAATLGLAIGWLGP